MERLGIALTVKGSKRNGENPGTSQKMRSRGGLSVGGVRECGRTLALTHSREIVLDAC